MFLDVLSVLLIWNLMVFALYGLDKRKAVTNQWRISEKTLLWSSFLFGGLGALLGGKYFHHKTQKWYFQVVWYLGVVVLMATLYALVVFNHFN
ncbi:DUF1294 domain-containing protein [Streptococcus iniae]|uniref:DUF1294 domain-containing protein n=1 Tax=Streptococcus iniae TaxID=1346 RepID=A0A3L8GLA2_STRIN|nr:DUF1294 domain-containing protein [Streptococcus iniae]AGM98434.1 membrane protein [Streptococcus iniae SF1]AHY15477.1 membrane protein [Streptococcus iniae]AHY17345.1 membrane protein [Streptococcus iniae]AJG25649.1 membrane protein [Streptococcus iniae]APD31519.1 hypothetical protein BMF34_03275 [Streptococcus iniae]